ncbi:MAG: hypothetical protein GPJ54_10080 [Candidatus Heimdallarchaeota archaeon]|nr:hypothetical protein [Candidatus Heimdallarchaeota archaeon]
MNPVIQPSYFREDSEFNVDIYFVGSSPLDEQGIEKNEMGVYEIKTEKTFPVVYLKVNISGYTSWNIPTFNHTYEVKDPVWTDVNGNYTFKINLENSSKTMGQFFLLVDGEVSILAGELINSNDLIVPVSRGDHAISIIHMGYDQDLGIQYAYDTIVVSVYGIDEVYIYETFSVNLDLHIKDQFEDGLISGKAIYVLWANALDQQLFFDVNSDSNLSLSEEFVITDSVDKYSINDTETTEINTAGLILNAITNSSGFSGVQILEEWDRVRGISFIVDALGIQPLDAEKVNLRTGKNFVGVVTFAPYGFWHRDIPCPQTCLMSFSDWDTPRGIGGINSTGYIITDIDSSFDFVAGISGETITLVITELISEETKETSFIGYITPFLVLVSMKLKRRRSN